MTLPRAEPLTFGPANRPCLGWLHRPPGGPRRGTGLVICKPFGYEGTLTDRSLRHFAEAAAAAGVPSLRFDYDGTGDSAGGDRDPDRLRAWVTSVHLAVDELKRLGPVTRVHLLGVRLGATIAAMAALDRDDIAGLMAIHPVLSGKAWLRELNALEIATRFSGPPPGIDVRSNELESVGFVITDETKKAVQGIDLVNLARAPTSEVLILDRNDLPPNTKWADRLAGLGATVDQRFVPGYAEMMLDPHESVVPVNMIAAATDWLVQRTGPPVVDAPVVHRSQALAPIPVSPGVEETAVFLDETSTLFGIVSAPADKPRPTRAIMLLNSGAIPRIGPSRLYVDLARRWAARGYLVLRFDQPGIGDSAPYPGDDENVVYSPSALRGVRAAMEFLTVRWGATETHAVGLCSGAYHAFKAAVAGFSLTSVVVINPLVFFWKEGMSLAYPPYQVSGAVAHYKRSFLRPEKWKRVLSGKADLRAFAHVAARRTSLRIGSLVRNIARTLGTPLPNDLGSQLVRVADQGIALSFVFSSGDPGEDLLRFQAGWPLRRLERNRGLRIHRIQGANHSFTRVWTRVVLTDVIEAALGLH